MKKRAMTLLEIMIVIFLIGMITSVIGYNMKGSIDKGKVFKTEESQKQIRDLLLLEAVKSSKSLEEISKNPRRYLEDSGMPKNVDKLLKDGWGDPFLIEPTSDKKDLVVFSKNLENYKNRKSKKGKVKSSANEDYSVE